MISDVYERHDSEPFKEPVDLSVYPVSKSLRLKYSNISCKLGYGISLLDIINSCWCKELQIIQD